MMTASLLPAIASGLALWPGLLLVSGGLAKAVDVAGHDLGDTVLARLIPGRRPLRAAWGLTAGAELSVGALVVAGVAVPWPEVAAALLLTGAALVAAWGLRYAPDAGCGCFGAAATTRLSVRTGVRAGFLAVLAALAVAGGASWTTVFDHAIAAAVTVAAGVALAWLSPELPGLRDAAAARVGGAFWQARALRHRACGSISLERSVAGLRRSELWQRAQPYVSAETPTEHWDEGCWRLVCYPAVYEGEPATAVFSIHLGLRQSPNTVAFVDEVEQRVLGRLEAGGSRA
jgi:hypothetical protein